ncbi:UDP-N-acetylmuramoyl-L-alanyl-D-glutamate--2,6-diaminopimelate ligase [bacterium]|nr:UDP-N-acetylmuramoyl-L-alanyl-D-glutamate--2,6-diaminopimelate ligase [bacterium]
MTLKQLLSIFGKIHWQKMSPDFTAKGVTSDSRKVEPGFVFVAVKGVSHDGHNFLAKAVQQGASALVVESTKQIPATYEGAILEVLDSAMSYSSLLAEYYLHPEEKLLSIGITGTNGKTSSSYLIEKILNQAGLPCGVMGTIDHHFKEKTWKSDLTTPDAATFYQRLQDFSSLGAKAYAMEVSSHSLKQKRVPTQFDVALFTNFTRDHLDYHQTMEDYFASKQKLFTEHLKLDRDCFVVLNNDDPMVSHVKYSSKAQKWTFGQGAECDFSFRITKTDIEGMEFELREKKSPAIKYKTTMIGKHNVENCVGAIAVARCLGVRHELCQQAIQNFSGVPGRLQRVPNRHRRHVFIDYAHTPDALEKVLQALEKLKPTSAQLITVFGCGGDRDQGKRPLMREVAQKYSTKVVVTSDNPRTEDPQKIIEQILAGASDLRHLTSVIDREEAFKKALSLSRANDILVIAGKGHEDYQIIGNQILPFSDFEKMKTLLERDSL